MTRPIRHIAGADAYHLYEETPQRPTHTVKVLVLDGDRDGGLTLAELRSHVRSRLPSIPILRQVVTPIPAKLYHPAWVDHGLPDLGGHIRFVDESEITDSWWAIAGTLASSPLPRDRPLWRMLLAPQTSERPAAVFVQLHHALADGHASARLLEALFGPEPRSTIDPLQREPVPSRRRLAQSGGSALGRSLAHLPMNVVRSVGAARRDRARRPEPAGARAFAGPSVPWARPLTRGRSAAWTSLALDDVHRVRAALGSTVGELVLAVVAGAARPQLTRRVSTRGSSLTAVVPIGVSEWSEAMSGNRNRHTFVSLHTDVADPVARLGRLSADLRAHRQRVTTPSIERWADWMEYYPLFRALYVATVLPMGRILRKPPASMIVSTVRGPRDELAIAGRRVASVYSIGVLTEYLGLNVTVWSYAEQLNFAVTCTEAFAPLAKQIAGRLPAAFVELADASGQSITLT